MSKRIYKLRTTSKINAAKIGKKSGRVLVTGSEDKKVTMWALGKQEHIMNSSAIESVTFDTAEQLVAAGSAGGTIKLWDLDEQKVVRTFNGHKSNCISLEFHPFGEFFASGSLDTDLKIWDLRRKGCIQTYRGHSKGVKTIRFSPDGRWVISGGLDGLVKLWDLTAGKLLHDFEHKGAVTSLEFHPQEFLLASSSEDKTLKYWDLETFDMISSNDVESNYIQTFAFATDGSCLFGAYSDSLKVWGWEPPKMYDQISVNWKEVADLYITNDQLVCCTTNNNNIGIWMVNPQKLLPLSKERGEESMSPSSPIPKTNVRSSTDLNRTTEALKELQDSLKSINMNSQFIPESPYDNNPTTTATTTPLRSNNATKVATANTSNTNNNREFMSPVITVPNKEKPLNLNMADFLPKNEINSDDILDEIMKPHATMCGVFSLRLTNLKVVRNIWNRSDIKECLETLIKLKDAAVEVDVLNILLEKPSLLNLDISVILLPMLQDLLSSQYEDYIVTSVKVVQLLLSSFGSIIKTSIEAPPSLGVDLSREERVEKCRTCNSELIKIRNKLESMNTSIYSTQTANSFREAVNLLKTFTVNPKT